MQSFPIPESPNFMADFPNLAEPFRFSCIQSTTYPFFATRQGWMRWIIKLSPALLNLFIAPELIISRRGRSLLPHPIPLMFSWWAIEHEISSGWWRPKLISGTWHVQDPINFPNFLPRERRREKVQLSLCLLCAFLSSFLSFSSNSQDSSQKNHSSS